MIYRYVYVHTSASASAITKTAILWSCGDRHTPYCGSVRTTFNGDYQSHNLHNDADSPKSSQHRCLVIIHSFYSISSRHDTRDILPLTLITTIIIIIIFVNTPL